MTQPALNLFDDEHSARTRPRPSGASPSAASTLCGPAATSPCANLSTATRRSWPPPSTISGLNLAPDQTAETVVSYDKASSLDPA